MAHVIVMVHYQKKTLIAQATVELTQIAQVYVVGDAVVDECGVCEDQVSQMAHVVVMVHYQIHVGMVLHHVSYVQILQLTIQIGI